METLHPPLTEFPSSKQQTFLIPEFSNHDGYDTDEDKEETEETVDDWRLSFREDEDDQTEDSSGQQGNERDRHLNTARSLCSMRSHRQQFSNCWFALLPNLKSSEAGSMRVLIILQNHVIPYLNNPIRLHDWVANCVQYGT